MRERIPVANINLDTGELLDATLAMIYPRQKNGFGTGWYAQAQDAMLKVAELNIGYETTRVLITMMGLLDYGNVVAIGQAELAERLHMRQPNVSRAIARLKRERILFAAPRTNGKTTYRLNPTFAWKGSAKTHNEALRENMKARGISVIEGG